MIKQIVILFNILTDKRITAVPLKVLRELRKRGIRRLPKKIDSMLGKGFPLFLMVKFLREWLGNELITKHKGIWVANSFTPPFPSQSFNRAFENLLDTKRRFNPISAFLSVTPHCHYSCWHCSIAKRKSGYLSTQTWLSAIEQLHELGVCIIGFTGGEPLTRDDLPKMIRAAHSGGATTILFTSGEGFTERLARALQDAGLWSLCVSLDSTDPEQVKAFRGHSDAYVNAISALRLSKKLNFYTMIGSVATRRFIEKKIYNDIYILAQREGVDEIRLVEPMPCGKLANEKKDHLLKKVHIDEIRAFHKKQNKKGSLPKVCAFNQIESPEVFGCAGGIQHLYIDTAGEVCPCDFTPLGFGSITDEKLTTIWERMNQALKLPRRHCIIQKNHSLFEKYYAYGYPIPKEKSVEICKNLYKDSLPDYYKMVLNDKE